jgi:cytochrome c553
MRTLKSLGFVLSLTFASASALASEEKAAPKADPAAGKTVATQVCAACHGADGNSTIAVNPKLAGQHPEYLYKQLSNFRSKDGKPAERVNAIMGALASGLSEADMRNVAAYYASQTQTPEKAKGAAKASNSARSCGVAAISPRVCRPVPAAMVRQVPACRPSTRASLASTPSTRNPS